MTRLSSVRLDIVPSQYSVSISEDVNFHPDTELWTLNIPRPSFGTGDPRFRRSPRTSSNPVWMPPTLARGIDRADARFQPRPRHQRVYALEKALPPRLAVILQIGKCALRRPHGALGGLPPGSRVSHLVCSRRLGLSKVTVNGPGQTDHISVVSTPRQPRSRLHC